MDYCINNKTAMNKMGYLNEIFDLMAEILNKTYELIPSCNRDMSRYLIPKGTMEDLSYYGKPRRSFRVSDHWNWYSTLNRCSDPNYIQCYTKEMPWTHPRMKCDKPHARVGMSIAFYGDDNRYHVIFGEVFDRKTKTWGWVAPTDVKATIEKLVKEG